MKPRGKTAGTRVEHKVRDWLLERDWWVARAAASLGDADLVALKAGSRPRLVEVKSTIGGPYHDFGPADRERLRFAAALADADAWLAWWPPRGPLRWLHSSEWPADRPQRLQGPTATASPATVEGG